MNPPAIAPQRVLQIVGRMDRAGAETMLMNLYREIDRNFIQFDFAYFSTEPCDYDREIEYLGGRIVRIPGNFIARFFNLWAALRKGNWQIVHVHTLFSGGMHLLAALLAGVPQRIAHSHSTRDVNSASLFRRLYQQLMRRLLAWTSSDFVACGTAAGQYLFPGRTDVVILPNAIDLDRFLAPCCDADRKSWGSADSCLAILQVGRLTPVKNQMFSLQVAEALRSMGHDFRLLLVGRGSDEQAIRAEVEARGLVGQVEIFGVREDIAELMAAADVMLMPSLFEGFPVVLVEAQAAGLPSVISDTISPEVDLGLGLVNFLTLSAAPETWANNLLAAATMPRPNRESRRKALDVHGFSAISGAKQLTRIYTGR